MSKVTYLLETEMYFEAVDESLPIEIEVEVSDDYDCTPKSVKIEGVMCPGFEGKAVIKKIVKTVMDAELCADLFYEEKHRFEFEH